MTKVIGIEHKEGNFQTDDGKNIDYDNIILHLVSDNNQNVEGLEASTLKIKRDKLQKMMKGQAPILLLDKEIIIESCFSSGRVQISNIRVASDKS